MQEFLSVHTGSALAHLSFLDVQPQYVATLCTHTLCTDGSFGCTAGKAEGGPRNRHRGADQWLFVPATSCRPRDLDVAVSPRSSGTMLARITRQIDRILRERYE